MGLGKILKLGGIDNTSPKTDQSIGRFRVARNVYPTPDGRLIPRYDNSDVSGFPTTNSLIQSIAPYNGNVITFAAKDRANGIMRLYSNNTAIPNGFYVDETLFPTIENFPQSQLYTRRNNTLYYLDPAISSSGGMYKYDGVELRPCGLNIPFVSSPDYTNSGTLKYVKVVQHSLDFDNNEPWSEALTFPIAQSDTALRIDLNTGVALPGSEGVTPTFMSYSQAGEENYFKGTATYNSVDKDFEITVTTTNLLNTSQIGSYVFIYFNYDISTTISVSTTPVTSLDFGMFYPVMGLALKVKSVLSGGKIKLDVYDSYGLNGNREWSKGVLNPGDPAGLTTLATKLKIGCKNFISVWLSSSVSGQYFYYGFYPSPTASTQINITVPVTPSATNCFPGSDKLYSSIAPNLNNIYDIYTSKISPNSFVYPAAKQFFGNWYSVFYCMTTYQDMLLLANDDVIWFSDTTLGGTFEQLNSFNYLKIGSSEQGRITAICGTNDFFVVCRERKNYYVNGNIATGNYRVQEMEEAELGAWSNSSAIRIKDNVVILTATGIFSISDGARCVRLSDKVTKNFATFDPNSINEDVSFRLTGTVSFPTSEADTLLTPDDSGIAVAYDEYRELLIFMQRKANSPCILVHTRTGEIYEWDGLYKSDTMTVNCISAISANIYLGMANNTIDYTNPALVYTSGIRKEDKTASLSYVTNNPIKLYTTWLTGDQPSLEKILLQLKMFGRVQSNGTYSSINVCHYKDWDITTKITSASYFPKDTTSNISNQVQYSHKKRLNSDKVLSASVGLEVNTTGVTFELESMEVEMTNIQESMKK